MNFIIIYHFFFIKNEDWKRRNLYDKTKNIIQIRNLKHALNHGLILKKVQKDWLNPYIEMNSKLRQKVKNNFEKDFFKLMNENNWKM